MKKKYLFFMMLFLSFLNLSAQETTTIVFEGRLDTSPDSSPTIKSCLPKSERLSSEYGGVIKVICTGDLSEEMKYCIRVAAQLWEEKLYIPKDVILRFEKESMGVGAADFAAEVLFSSTSDFVAYPQSYYMNFITNEPRSSGKEDAVIRINTNVDWDYGFSNSTVSKKNLTTAMLRAIAMSLGFGTSVINNSVKGIVFSVPRYFSPFDNLVVNSNNVRLNEMPNRGRTSPELVSYITGNNVYFNTANDQNYKLYAPSDYEEFNTLNYLDTEGDLMSYKMCLGDKNQQIDHKTLEVLKTIGWKTVDNTLRILADGIDDTGMASAFQGYIFRTEIASGDITSYSWKYELMNKEMKFVTVKTASTPTFSIDKVDDITKYDKNVNGDIKGRITLNAVVNGKNISKEFFVYLASKPTFISVKVDAITPIPGTILYDLDLTVIYTGADYLHAEVTEEFSSIGYTGYYYEPYVAHLHFESIYRIGMTWVDLSLRNKEGSETFTVEIPDQTQLQSATGEMIESINSKGDNVNYIEIRDLQGKLIDVSSNYDNINSLPHGVYIQKVVYSDGKVTVQKICR